MRPSSPLTLTFPPLLLLLALTAHAGSDDTWRWRSSQDLEGGPYAWPTPANLGSTDLGLGTGDQATVSLPFAFPFYGSTYSQVTVTASGLIVLSGTASARGSACVGDGSASGAFVAPWWRDWDLDAGGTVYAGTTPEGLVVQWDGVRAGADTETVSFGAVLYATGEVRFLYKDANTGLSTTRRGRDGAIGLQSSGDAVSFGCDAQVLEKSASYALWFTPRGLRTLADEVDLTTHGDAWLGGEATGDEAGAALAVVQDWDGDGLQDLAVGAPGGDRAYVVSGAALSGSSALADAGAIVVGSAGSRLGTTLHGGVEGGADVDGDGLADLLVGAPADPTGGADAGAAWLVLGGQEGTLGAADALAFTGPSAGDEAGSAVLLPGDLDGDGYGELLIGGPGADGDAGAVWVVLGQSTPAGLDLSAAVAVLEGSGAERAGAALAALGDADGDGLGDLAIGAPAANTGDPGGGVVYLLYAVDVAAGSQPLSGSVDVLGTGSGWGWGGVLAASGDLGGDGTLDLLAGAPDAASGDGAAVWIKSKSTPGGWPSRTGAADGALGGLGGEGLGAALGTVGLGDDALSDLTVGAPAVGGGLVYVVDARDLGTTAAYAEDIAHGHVLALGSGDRLGAALAALDVDGDGEQDLLLGAPGADGSAAGAGAVWLLLGEPTYPDADGDGYLPTGWGGLDCNDSSAKANPGRGEKCDGLDNNCDGDTDEGYPDTDADSTADCLDTEECDTLDNDGDGAIDEGFPDADGDGLCDGAEAEDCDGVDNDGDGDIDEGWPDTDADGTADCLDAEECDGLDNDGDSSTDEGYPDTDRDGTADCVDREGCDGLDNDGDGTIDEGFPDVDGDGDADCLDTEGCDGLDNDGDGDIDEGLPDADTDGLCDELDSEDCDGLDNDGDRRIDEGYPDADGDGRADCLDGEDCDGLDNDGDGATDEGWPDADLDGTADCQDQEACDGLDNDGDTAIDEGMPDADLDGTCDALEVEDCDGLDNNGDGVVDEGYPDVDNDRAADCIDAEECDGIDNDGDGDIDEGFGDWDADGTPDCLDPDRPTLPPDGVLAGGGGASPWGCATAGSPGALAALLGLLGLARRRR